MTEGVNLDPVFTGEGSGLEVGDNLPENGRIGEMSARPNQIIYCQTLTTSARVTYDAIGKAYCPFLKEDVIFNARGFHHLNYNSDGTARDVVERIHKLLLVPLVVPVIKNATAIAQERDIKIRESRKKAAPIKDAKTYSLVALVGRKNPIEVRVILMRIGNGILQFRSVMKD